MATDIGGVWRTVGGRRILIKDGEDLETAMKKSGKFKNKNVKKEEKYDIEKYGDLSNPDNYMKAQNDLVFNKNLSVEESEKILGKYQSKDTFRTLDKMIEEKYDMAINEQIEDLQKKANELIFKIAKSKNKK